MSSDPPLYQGLVGFAISIAPVAIALVVVHRHPSSRLEGATFLVLWGLIIVTVEHATFGLSEFGGADVLRHDGLHFQMLAAYGLAGLALAAVVVTPLIRRGDRIGWYGLLILILVGVGAELATAVVTTPHGLPPRFWSWGFFLWGYPVAWGLALTFSHGPIFRGSGPQQRWGTSPTVDLPEDKG